MRLFIGIDLPGELKRELCVQLTALHNQLPAARWIKADNIHLTLVFLGEQEESSVEEIDAVASEALGHQNRFRIQLARAGAFPPGRPARVLWIGLEEQDVLQKLQSELVKGLIERVGLNGDSRPFHAHLTLARGRRPWPTEAVERWKKSFEGRVGAPFEVTGAHLFRSHLERGGAVHEILRTYPCGGIS